MSGLRRWIWAVPIVWMVLCPTRALTQLVHPLEGEWVGVLSVAGEPLDVRAFFERRPLRITGSIEVLDQRLSIPTSVELDGDLVRFRLVALELGPVDVEGTLDGDRFVGTAETGGVPGIVRLHRLARPSQATLEAQAGWYLSPRGDGTRLVFTDNSFGGLWFYDLEGDAPAGGHRWPVGDATYVRIGASGEIDQRMVFESGEKGEIRGVRWLDLASQEATLSPRVDEPPYDLAHLTFEGSGGARLFGVLLLPSGSGPHPAVAYLHGAPSISNLHYQYWDFVVADHLARSGVAVLLHDKRGSGKSEGEARRATFGELATDLQAAVETLRGHPAVDPRRLGIMGLSEAGWVLPIVASRSPSARFVVMLSGSTLPVADTIRHEVASLAQRAGFESAEVDQVLELQDLAMSYAADGSPASWRRYGDSRARLLSGPLAGRGIVEGFPARPFHWKLDLQSIRMREGLVDSRPFWVQIGAPVLAVYGGQDVRTPVQESVSRLGAMLAEAGNPGLTVRVYDDSGHGLRDPATGRHRTQFLELVSEWILRLEPSPTPYQAR